MNKWTALAMTVAIVGLTAAADAQRGMRRGGGNYDPATEAAVTGTVEQVTHMPAPGRGGGGLHLTLKTAAGPIEVHVGPAAFVSSKNVVLAQNDALTVVGSKVVMGGEEVILARQITKGEQVLTLRDEKGFPLWSGRGQRD